MYVQMKVTADRVVNFSNISWPTTHAAAKEHMIRAEGIWKKGHQTTQLKIVSIQNTSQVNWSTKYTRWSSVLSQASGRYNNVGTKPSHTLGRQCCKLGQLQWGQSEAFTYPWKVVVRNKHTRGSYVNTFLKKVTHKPGLKPSHAPGCEKDGRSHHKPLESSQHHSGKIQWDQDLQILFESNVKPGKGLCKETYLSLWRFNKTQTYKDSSHTSFGSRSCSQGSYILYPKTVPKRNISRHAK